MSGLPYYQPLGLLNVGFWSNAFFFSLPVIRLQTAWEHSLLLPLEWLCTRHALHVLEQMLRYVRHGKKGLNVL